MLLWENHRGRTGRRSCLKRSALKSRQHQPRPRGYTQFCKTMDASRTQWRSVRRPGALRPWRPTLPRNSFDSAWTANIRISHCLGFCPRLRRRHPIHRFCQGVVFPTCLTLVSECSERFASKKIEEAPLRAREMARGGRSRGDEREVESWTDGWMDGREQRCGQPG